MNQRGGSHGLDLAGAWSTVGVVMPDLLFASSASNWYAASDPYGVRVPIRRKDVKEILTSARLPGGSVPADR
jgi:hypothetical protein